MFEKYESLSNSKRPQDRVMLARTLGELNQLQDLLELRVGADDATEIAIVESLGNIDSQSVIKPLIQSSCIRTSDACF